MEILYGVGPGTLLEGRYELVAPLHSGGMGTIWLAEQRELGIHVAAKFVRLGIQGEVARARLKREAQAAARIDHPAALRVYDVVAAPSGDPVVIMELLEGETLGDVLAREGRCEPKWVVQVVLPVMEALEMAHALGIVHRDVKPENVVLARRRDGKLQPKLVDFGVARMTVDGRRRLTGTGCVLGTPDYVSPEQAMGEDVDAQSDVWSIAVLLYEMIAGNSPFVADDWPEVLRRVWEEEPESLLGKGLVDGELWQIISRGLTKPRGERWPSMSAFGSALSTWLLRRGVRRDVVGQSLRFVWHGCDTRSAALLEYAETQQFHASKTEPLRASDEPKRKLERARHVATLRMVLEEPQPKDRTLRLSPPPSSTAPIAFDPSPPRRTPPTPAPAPRFQWKAFIALAVPAALTASALVWALTPRHIPHTSQLVASTEVARAVRTLATQLNAYQSPPPASSARSTSPSAESKTQVAPLPATLSHPRRSTPQRIADLKDPYR